ncbi:MAG: hypothetical protein KDJ52_08015 [Anaerolineae bacterium]|nr:hypothetical protein [Anaerolineae bacterium]
MTTKVYTVFNDIKPEEESLLSDDHSKVSCYKTDSFKVTNICHHCGRFLSRKSEFGSAIYQDPSLELARILRGGNAKAAHCQTHAHFLPYSPRKVLILPGVLVSIFGGGWLFVLLRQMFDLGAIERIRRGFELLPLNEAWIFLSPLLSTMWAVTLVPFSILVLGLFLIAVGWYQHWVFYTRSMSRPVDAIPLLSEFYNVSVTEKVELEMILSATEPPQLKMTKGHGDIALETFLRNEDIQKVREAYTKKGKKYGFSSSNEFNLGWLSVDWSPYAQHQSDQQVLAMKRSFDQIMDTKIADWYTIARYNYEIIPEAIFTRGNIPGAMTRALLWVRPTVKNLSGGHTLQLEFDVLSDREYLRDWRYQPLEDDVVANDFWQNLTQARLEYVKIEVDKYPFANSTEKPILKSRGRLSTDNNMVQWQNIRLKDILTGNSQEISQKNYSRDYPLTITFARPLTEFQTPIKVDFCLSIETASLSGVKVEPKHFWFPNGHSAETGKQSFSVEYKTQIQGNLIINPNIFAFQLERTASDVIPRKKGIPLTSEVMTKLTKKLEDNKQIHIKSVTRSTPMAESENDLAYQRVSWNILGRVYSQNNHPIDVYILLVSRTPLVEGETTNWGNVTYRCLHINQGSNYQDKGDSLQKEIDGRCQSLSKTLQKILHPKDAPPDWQTVTSRILGQA